MSEPAVTYLDVEVDGVRTAVRTAGGVVDAVGADLRPSPGDDVVDGGGGALLPGLHDHHVHLLALAGASASVAVGPPAVRTRAELAAALAAADHHAAPGAWLRAVGYHDAVAGPLDRHAVDTLLAHRPVRVQHRSGALWVLNGAALAAAGIGDVATDDEPAGVERDAAGRPTGRLYRADAWLRTRLPSGAVDLAAVGRRLRDLGVTGVTDATPFASAAAVAPLLTAAGDGTLGLHLAVTGAPGSGGVELPAGVRRGPAKLLLADHDLPGLDEVVAAVGVARAEGRSVAVHCVTLEALVLTLVALRDAGARPGDRIEHGAVVPVALFAELRDLGLTVVTQPGFVAERGDEYRAEVDPADLADLWRCRTLLDAGVRVAAGIDAPFAAPDPWTAVTAATRREAPSGAPVGVDEAVPAARALELFLGPLDDPAGPPRRVRPGATADLCLLDRRLADALDAPTADAVRGTALDGWLRPRN